MYGYRARIGYVSPVLVNGVIASQSIIWHVLRRCGLRDPISGYGHVSREH